MPPAAEDFGSLLPGAIVHDNRMHCSGMEECRLRDPPQAENPAEQDSIVVLCGSDRFQQERVGDAWDALPLVVARFGKQRAGGDE